MKSDGDAMETTEPNEAAPEPSVQEMAPEQDVSQPEPANDAAPPKANGQPLAADPAARPKAALNKPSAKSAGAPASNSRPGASSQRGANGAKPLNNGGGAKKPLTAAKSSPAAGAVPKKPTGVVSAGKSQAKAPEKKAGGPSRAGPLPAAPMTNGTKAAAVNGSTKTRPASENARARTAAPSRPAATSTPKPGTSTATKPAAAASKTNKPVAGPPKPRPATSRPTTAASKPPTPAAGPPATRTPSRATTAPSSGRPAAAQPPKPAPPKKDVGRPLSAAVAKKPTAGAAAAAGTTAAATRKPEASKPTAASKTNPASKLSQTPKASEPKSSQPAALAAKKQTAAAVRFPANTKPPLGRTPPASPVSRTAQPKRGAKPTQAVLPLTVTKTKKTPTKNPTAAAVPAQAGPCVAADEPGEAPASIQPESPPAENPDPAAPEANVPAETATESPDSTPQESPSAAPVPDPAAPETIVEAPESATQEPAPAAPVPDPAAEIVPEAPESLDASVGDSSLPADVGLVPGGELLHASASDSAALDADVPTEEDREAPEPVPQEPSLPAPVPQETHTPEEASPPPSPPPSAPQDVDLCECQEPLQSDAPPTVVQEVPGGGEVTPPPVESPPDFSEEPALRERSPSASEGSETAADAVTHKDAHGTLNEDEDEEEREGSQLISVSEMSGTTQPTEDSRPGSGGPIGGSAWRAGGALLSELDSEEVSGSQQGASELSAPGVLEGTESMDDLGDGSLKGAIDMEGASAGSPDFEKVPDIPANDFEEDEEDDDDRVCDMDVGSERADEPQRPRHDNDVEDEDDDDVEMASEGITESGLESYGNADEDDFVEEERLDNLNRVGQHPPPPPLLPSAPAAQWDQPNPLAHPWAEPPQQLQGADGAAECPLVDPWQADSETPTQTPAQAWLELGLAAFASENQDRFSARDPSQNLQAVPEAVSAPRVSLSGTLSSKSSTPEEQPLGFSSNPELNYQDLVAQMERREGEEEEEAETLPADEVLGGPATAPASNPSSSSSASEDEPSDTEGEAHLDGSLGGPIIPADTQAASQRCLSTVEEGEEADMECAVEDTTPPSATSLASYGYDTVTTASNSNAHSTGESCIKSPGIFSLEELPDEPRKPGDVLQPHAEPCLSEQHYIECRKEEEEEEEEEEEAERPAEGDQGPKEALDPSSTPGVFQLPEESPDDLQPPYYSAIREKTENSFAGFTALPHPHRPDHAACPRNHCDVVRPCGAADGSPKLARADLPPRSPGPQPQPPGPQLCRLERHQRRLLELQQRCPPEEAEQGREGKEKEEDQEEEVRQRRDLELQLQQQQEELKQRQQIMHWQQELQQANKGQAVLLSPSSGLCTIYEALESGDEEEGDANKREPRRKIPDRREGGNDSSPFPTTPPPPDSPETPDDPPGEGDASPSGPAESPEQPSPPDLDWGKKVDIVQQLINQTLLLNREGCSSLLLLPGGAGGTLSPLESSLWPSLLPPLTPPSATVTSVSSFSPETTGSSPQEEWTVVELETHH